MKRFLLMALATLSLTAVQAQQHWGDLQVDAQLRTRGEYRNGTLSLRDQGATPALFINDRVRLGIGWERQQLSLKLVAQHTGVWGDDSQTNNSNKGNINLFEAWAKLRFGQGGFLQLGRQTLVYDDERLLGGLDWAATGRSHDVLRVGYVQGEHKLHAFVAYNQDAENRIDNYYSGKAVYKTMQAVWYHYGVKSPLGLSALILNQGVETGDADAHSVKYMQTMGLYATYRASIPLSGNASFYYQTGKDKAGKSVSAYLLSVNAKWQFLPSLSLAIGDDYVSGSKVNSQKNNTFNVLYGTHHKFYGTMDYFNNTTMPAQGLNDLNATVTWKASKAVDSFVAVHYFATAQKLEGYDKSLGTEVDLQINWRILKDVTLQGGYSVMAATRTMEYYKGGNHNSWQDWIWVSLNINPTLFTTKR